MKAILACVAVLCCSVALAATGTNGAGEKRTWTPTTGDSVKASFVSVKDGVVLVKHDYQHIIKEALPPTTHHVTSTNVLGQHQSGTVLIPQFTSKNVTDTETLHWPLGKLSMADRLWVEEKNPAACCLGKSSHKGTAGTLAPATGEFRVAKIMDSDNALLDYVVGDSDNKWHVWLKSSEVGKLKEGDKLKRIPAVDKPGHDFVVTGHKMADYAIEKIACDVVEDGQ